MPLSVVRNGETVRLVSVRAGRGLQARLASLGMVPGVEITMIRNDYHGPMIVAVKGSRLVLGRGMSGKILVQ